MVTIQGPITFKKGEPLPNKVKEALKQSMGLQEISREEARERFVKFAEAKPAHKKEVAK